MADTDADISEKPSPWARLNLFQKTKEDESATALQEGEQKKKEEEENLLPPVSLPALFRYTTTPEKLQMLIACIAAIIHGLMLPLFTIIFGKVSLPLSISFAKSAPSIPDLTQ